MPVKGIEPMKNGDINDKEFCVIKEDITKECEVCQKNKSDQLLYFN